MKAEHTRTEVPVFDGRALADGFNRALERLKEQRGRINDLNVFPVPDGDTGSNMHLTLRAAVEEVSRLGRGPGIGDVAKAAAHGALMGARGNSGVILSQVLRGFASACEGKRSLGPSELAEALAEASRVARRAVKRPAEGTILSVIRDAAEVAFRLAKEGSDIAGLSEATVAEAWASVERSRDQLEELRTAGVVDAGGFGLAVILTAISERLTGPGAWPSDIVSGEASGASSGAGIEGTELPEDGFGYCTEFSLVGSDKESHEVRAELGSEDEEDSSLVVGERGLLHVHIHTQEPWEILTRAARLGKIERLKVEDMTAQHQQARERSGRKSSKDGAVPMGVVAVAQGFGFRQLLLGLGAAAVVDGGQSMNPPASDLLHAVEEERLSEAVLLPNNPNLVLVAEQAARMSRSEVAVVPTRSVPEGIAALLAFDPEAPLEINRRRMERAIGDVKALEVTRAVRDSDAGRSVKRGDYLVVLDGSIVSSGGALDEVVLEALGHLDEGSTEVVTLYRGADVEVKDTEKLEGKIRSAHPGWEVERQDGGQPVYHYIISAE